LGPSEDLRFESIKPFGLNLKAPAEHRRGHRDEIEWQRHEQQEAAVVHSHEMEHNCTYQHKNTHHGRAGRKYGYFAGGDHFVTRFLDSNGKRQASKIAWLHSLIRPKTQVLQARGRILKNSEAARILADPAAFSYAMFRSLGVPNPPRVEFMNRCSKSLIVLAFAMLPLTRPSSCAAITKALLDSDGPANAAATSVYNEAVRILSSIQSTKYEHKTDIDEKEGRYYCDCSGFVGYVLNQTVSKDDRNGPLHNGDRRPVAAEFERHFETAPTKPGRAVLWQHITRMEDARPGDVIAWRLAVPKPNDTGHVVILAERPVAESDGLIKVQVIDSTVLPSPDLTADKGKSGIGRRVMWFTVDKEGRPTGYIRGSRSATPKTDAIAIGRALPADAKISAKRRPA
jgi:hypothetical protein